MQAKIRLITRLLCFFSVLVLMESCALFKSRPAKTERKTEGASTSPFFDNIVVALKPSIEPVIERDVTIKPIEEVSVANYISGIEGIEHVPALLFRYAVLMDVEVENLKNKKLIEYIHQWWGVPYRIGGYSMSGIDCSAFTQLLTSETYGLKLPRTSREQANQCVEISKDLLREGDLVFFKTGRGISHVGLYLSNNKFVHASTSMGVVISDLNELYWDKRFVKAGRILN